ncbi:MAG: hypothetical protein ACE5E6_04945 [Phycisphaerae bacterium]
MKLLKLVLFLAMIAGVIVVVARLTQPSTTTPPPPQQAGNDEHDTKPKKQKPKLEERYGFTGEQAGP